MPAELIADIVVERAGVGGFRLEAALTATPGITCILGRSGSGKSTFLGSIAGLVRPSRGRVSMGEDLWFDHSQRIDRPTRDRHVAYVFQGLALFPHMNAIHNVMYGMPRTLSRAEKREHATALLEKVGVRHLADRRPRTYSGGEAQRVALARALAMRPQAVLLDEPFSALDRDLRRQLARLVRELVDEKPVPLIHVTHNVYEARVLADVVVRMDHGRIIEQGPPRDVLPRGRDDELDGDDSG